MIPPEIFSEILNKMDYFALIRMRILSKSIKKYIDSYFSTIDKVSGCYPKDLRFLKFFKNLRKIRLWNTSVNHNNMSLIKKFKKLYYLSYNDCYRFVASIREVAIVEFKETKETIETNKKRVSGTNYLLLKKSKYEEIDLSLVESIFPEECLREAKVYQMKISTNEIIAAKNAITLSKCYAEKIIIHGNIHDKIFMDDHQLFSEHANLKTIIADCLFSPEAYAPNLEKIKIKVPVHQQYELPFYYNLHSMTKLKKYEFKHYYSKNIILTREFPYGCKSPFTSKIKKACLIWPLGTHVSSRQIPIELEKIKTVTIHIFFAYLKTFLLDLTFMYKFDKVIIHVFGKESFEYIIPESIKDQYYVYHINSQSKVIFIAKN